MSQQVTGDLDNIPEGWKPIKRKGLKYLETSVSQHGQIRHYLRKGKKQPRVRLHGTPGTPEFMAQYQAALNGAALPAPQAKKREPREGWSNVYVIFVVGGRRDRVKIGVARNPIARARELQIGAGAKLRVYEAVPVLGWMARALERKVHQDLAEHRIRGEWFAVTPMQALEAIQQNLSRE